MKEIISWFRDVVDFEWEPEAAQIDMLQRLLQYSRDKGYKCSKNYQNSFLEAVNQKLAINQNAYQHILDVAFMKGVKLNYLLKTDIRAFLDKCDLSGYKKYIRDAGISSPELENAFAPASQDETMKQFDDARRNDSRFIEMASAIFSRYCFNLFEKECTALFFSNEKKYVPDYFDYISSLYPDMCLRNNALSFIDITPTLFDNGYEQGCNTVLHAIKSSYERLNNHCDMAVYIPDVNIEGHSVQWELFADAVLFAEKMNTEEIDRAYFRWKKIKAVTEAYIDGLSDQETAFSTAFQGFVFKDCFIIQQEEHYDLLLIFEKNKRDERLINCPACRSTQIEGNSYPILNVRSWECQNPLCPDRSKYNRGKRYGFSSIMRQKLMADEANRIPEDSIADWHLDCVFGHDKQDAFSMVLRHYSCVDDGVFIFSSDQEPYASYETYGRKLTVESFEKPENDVLAEFKTSSYFTRYIQTDSRLPKEAPIWHFSHATIFNGDSFEVLKGIGEATIDGAVTSPPYYNAKEYSQWENIYCYLYDMYNISAEVYRALKPGAIYLFNIFDYFDNENNIVLSAMGNKRMILGAYMLDIFQRIGFTVQGNIIWYKGEIQGNRSFNQGNLTPYYQAPLNCWEHVFILSKGTPADKYKGLTSHIEAIRPVIKMVRGKNTLGHTAPYPEEIPDLLIKHMKSGDVVLDPFLGSGTTTIAAEKRGIDSIGIEMSPDYFELEKKLIPERSCAQISFL